jgi:hypothetical protein
LQTVELELQYAIKIILAHALRPIVWYLEISVGYFKDIVALPDIHVDNDGIHTARSKLLSSR